MHGLRREGMSAGDTVRIGSYGRFTY
jgi:hypothetical protein